MIDNCILCSNNTYCTQCEDETYLSIDQEQCYSICPIG